jgi:hypothetical protein
MQNYSVLFFFFLPLSSVSLKKKMSQFTDQDIRLALISAKGNTARAAEILSSGRVAENYRKRMQQAKNWKKKNARLRRRKTEAEKLYSARGMPRYLREESGDEDDSSGEDGVELIGPTPDEDEFYRARDRIQRNEVATRNENFLRENERRPRNPPYGMPAFGMPRFGDRGDDVALNRTVLIPPEEDDF